MRMLNSFMVALLILVLDKSNLQATAKVRVLSDYKSTYYSDESHKIGRRSINHSSSVNEDNDQYYERVGITTRPNNREFYSAFFEEKLSSSNSVTEFINGSGSDPLEIKLKFLFYFYGHPVSHIGVSSMGYITILDSGHEPAFIAPLKADFLPYEESDTSSENGTDVIETGATVSYNVSDSSVWVRWSNLRLLVDSVVEPLSFQCAIFKNGSIIFNYINIPDMSSPPNGSKAGLADVFTYQQNISALDRHINETIIHKAVNIQISLIFNNSWAFITAHTSCGSLTNCAQCMTASLTPKFECNWCFQRGECGSNHQVRLQSWLLKPCHYPVSAACKLGSSTDTDSVARGILIFLLAILLAMLVGLVLFVCIYGHRQPDSGVGQCLMSTRHQLARLLGRVPRLPNATFSSSSGGQVRLQEEDT